MMTAELETSHPRGVKMPTPDELAEDYKYGVAEDPRVLSQVLRVMGELSRAGESTLVFEEYFDKLITKLDLSTMNPNFVGYILSYLTQYRNGRPRETARFIYNLEDNIREAKRYSEDELSSFLLDASHSLANLDQFEGASSYWLEAMEMMVSVDDIGFSSIVGAAMRNDKMKQLKILEHEWLRLADLEAVRRFRSWKGVDGDLPGLKIRLRLDVKAMLEHDRLLAIEYNLPKDVVGFWLESEMILEPLSAGRFDKYLALLKTLASKHLESGRFVSEVKKRELRV